MKKPLIILLALSLSLTSCTLFELEVDSEPREEYIEPSEEDSEPTEEDSEPTEEDSVLREEYSQPLIFLEKHKMSTWKRTGKYDHEQIFYLRIMSESDIVTEIWSSSNTNEIWSLTNTDKDCYFKGLYYGGSNFSIVEDTENNLIIEGMPIFSSSLRRYEMSIRNDTLIESRDFYSGASAIIEINTWVRSEVNVDSLKLCEYTPDGSNPPPPF